MRRRERGNALRRPVLPTRESFSSWKMLLYVSAEPTRAISVPDRVFRSMQKRAFWSGSPCGRGPGGENCHPNVRSRFRSESILYRPISVMNHSPVPRWAPLLVAPFAGILLLNAWHYYPFLSDDALISLRYARRMLTGHGLSWTDGQPVEGTRTSSGCSWSPFRGSLASI